MTNARCVELASMITALAAACTMKPTPQTTVMTTNARRKPGWRQRPANSRPRADSTPPLEASARWNMSGRGAASDARHTTPNTPVRIAESSR